MMKFIFPLFFGAALLSSCGKPTSPETLPDVDDSGGYRIVAKLATPGFAQDVKVRDTLAYLAQGEGGLLIVSVADPSAPRILSVCYENARGYSVNVALKDNAAYLAAGTFGVTVINVANPLAPVVTEANLAMKPARDFHVFGNYLFTSISEQGVKISDISFAIYPDIRGGFTTPGYARGMSSTPDSNFLLVAIGEMGLYIADISDMQDGFGAYPGLGWCDTPGYAEAVVTKGDEPYALVASGSAGLQIIDFSDTAYIHIAASFSTGGYAQDVLYQDGLAFVTTRRSGLQIIALDDVRNPRRIGTVRTSYAQGIAMDQNYIYLADEVEGLIIVARPHISITH